MIEDSHLNADKFKFRPELIGRTLLLYGELVDSLNAMLPVRYRQYDWSLTYSISEHGASINQFYRLLKSKGPTITIIQESHGNIFGGLVLGIVH